MLCARRSCGDYTVITYGQRTDGDQYYLFYSGDQLVQVSVVPYLDMPTYCLAGSSAAFPVDTSKCSLIDSCMPPCTLQPVSSCGGMRSCGAGTQVTMCDGATRTFASCECSYGPWYCDGAAVEPCAIDGGAD